MVVAGRYQKTRILVTVYLTNISGSFTQVLSYKRWCENSLRKQANMQSLQEEMQKSILQQYQSSIHLLEAQFDYTLTTFFPR